MHFQALKPMVSGPKTVCLAEKAMCVKRNGVKNALKGLFLFWGFVFLVAYHENYLLIP